MLAIPIADALLFSDDVCRFATGLCLGLALDVRGDRCAVLSETARRCCGRPLAPFLDHVPGRAKAIGRRNSSWTHVAELVPSKLWRNTRRPLFRERMSEHQLALGGPSSTTTSWWPIRSQRVC